MASALMGAVFAATTYFLVDRTNKLFTKKEK